MGFYHFNAASPGQAVNAVFTYQLLLCGGQRFQGGRGGAAAAAQTIGVVGRQCAFVRWLLRIARNTSAGAYVRFRSGRLFLAAYFWSEAGHMASRLWRPATKVHPMASILPFVGNCSLVRCPSTIN